MGAQITIKLELWFETWQGFEVGGLFGLFEASLNRGVFRAVRACTSVE